MFLRKGARLTMILNKLYTGLSHVHGVPENAHTAAADLTKYIQANVKTMMRYDVFFVLGHILPLLKGSPYNDVSVKENLAPVLITLAERGVTRDAMLQKPELGSILDALSRDENKIIRECATQVLAECSRRGIFPKGLLFPGVELLAASSAQQSTLPPPPLFVPFTAETLANLRQQTVFAPRESVHPPLVSQTDIVRSME